MPTGTGLLRDLLPHGGSLQAAFEEFCSQLAEAFPPDDTSQFIRLRGGGGDGGVECFWRRADSEEWAWQAKYVDTLEKLTTQATKSFETALDVHPHLCKYTICFPFDPTGPTGRRGRSQSEKLDDLKSSLETKARARGRRVTIEYWPESRLGSKLLDCDPSGGRRLYWFGAVALTHHWFRQHLREALDHAGPRYTSDLHVEHPIHKVLDAFCGSAHWQGHLLKLAENLDKAAKPLADMNERDDERAWGSVPKQFRKRVRVVLARCRLVSDELRKASREIRAPLVELALRKLTWTTHGLKTRLASDLAEKHGADAVHSEQFRQFQREYQISFPAEPYDRAKDLDELAQSLAHWSSTPEAGPVKSTPLLILGAAGVGKTHSLCQYAVERQGSGAPSLLLFGDRFPADGEIWRTIADRVGLGQATSQAQLLDSLDAAGQASGAPLVLVIDALNESPSGFWLHRLRSWCAEVCRRPWLRQILTCRSGFQDLVVPEDLACVTYNHAGFVNDPRGVTQRFFTHYGLVPPLQPPLPAEFGNPLFLKMVCETLQASGQTFLEFGWRGWERIIGLLLDAKSQSLWLSHQVRPALRSVQRALQALGRAMMQREVRWLTYEDACALVSGTSILPPATFVDWLVFENLLLLDRRLSHAAGGGHFDVVSISFDRLRDYVVALAFAEECTVEGSNVAVGPSLTALASRGYSLPEDQGPLELLSLMVPERWGIELPDMFAGSPSLDRMNAITVYAMRWRTPENLSDRSRELLNSFISDVSSRTRALAFDTAFCLSLEPSVADALFLHKYLASISMAERDGFLAGFLHVRVGQDGELTQFLNVPTTEETRLLSSEVALRWLLCLMWFFSAADRRVRDKATRSALQLASDHASILPECLALALEVDDDYVRERFLAVLYGVLVRTTNAPALSVIAERVYRFVLQGSDWPANGLIRDHARCIIDLALTRGAISPESVAHYQPPYVSDWPLEIPAQDVKPTEDDRFGLRAMYRSCTWDDFFSYTLGCAEGYDLNYSKADFGRWIYAEAKKMGYGTEAHDMYDSHMVGKYGGGRGRPAWAERIGKKYQLIALSRLLARLADNARKSEEGYSSYERHSEHSLVARSLRDIDVTVGVPKSNDEELQGWSTIKYDFSAFKDQDDEAWLSTHADVEGLIAELMRPTYGGRADWYPLYLSAQYVQRSDDKEQRGFERQVWLHLRSCLVPIRQFQRTWASARTADFSSHRAFPEGYDISEPGYIGEYPWAPVYDGWNGGTREAESPTWLKPPVPLVATTHSIGWTFDDCSGLDGRPHIHVPISPLLKGLQWNRSSGYVDETGSTIFVDPTFGVGGNSALLVAKSYLDDWLRSNKFSLLWVVTGEKLLRNFEQIKRLNFETYAGVHRGKFQKRRSMKTFRD